MSKNIVISQTKHPVGRRGKKGAGMGLDIDSHTREAHSVG